MGRNILGTFFVIVCFFAVVLAFRIAVKERTKTPLGFYRSVYSHHIDSQMSCNSDKMEQEAEVIVKGRILKVEGSLIRSRLATFKVNKIIKGENILPEIIIEFTTFEDQDLQPRKDLAGKVFLTKLHSNHYRLFDGICGWEHPDQYNFGSTKAYRDYYGDY